MAVRAADRVLPVLRPESTETEALGGTQPQPRAARPAAFPAPSSRKDAVSATPSGLDGLRPLNPSPPTISLSTLPGYREASGAVQSRLDALYAASSPLDQSAIRALLSTGVWVQADAVRRAQLLDIAERLPRSESQNDPDVRTDVQGHGRRPGLQTLADLCNTLRVDGTPKILDMADDGGTLLSHLHAVATNPPDAEVLSAIAPQGHGEILLGLLREVTDPGRINQGRANSCGAVVIQYDLVSENPAEYVRLCAGLLHGGTVRMRNGDVLRRDNDSVFPTAVAWRTPTERIFQSALMEYGSPANYRSVNRGQDDIQDGTVAQRMPLWLRVLLWIVLAPVQLVLELVPYREAGLTGWEYNTCAEAIFGRPMSSRYSMFGLPNDATSQLAYLERMAPDGNLAGRGVCILVDWGGGHFLGVQQLDTSCSPPALICRNPWGSDSDRSRGDAVGDPAPADVTFEDPEEGLVRIPLDDASVARISGIFYPESMTPADAPSSYNIGDQSGLGGLPF